MRDHNTVRRLIFAIGSEWLFYAGAWVFALWILYLCSKFAHHSSRDVKIRGGGGFSAASSRPGSLVASIDSLGSSTFGSGQDLLSEVGPSDGDVAKGAVESSTLDPALPRPGEGGTTSLLRRYRDAAVESWGQLGEAWGQPNDGSATNVPKPPLPQLPPFSASSSFSQGERATLPNGPRTAPYPFADEIQNLRSSSSPPSVESLEPPMSAGHSRTWRLPSISASMPSSPQIDTATTRGDNNNNNNNDNRAGGMVSTSPASSWTSSLQLPLLPQTNRFSSDAKENLDPRQPLTSAPLLDQNWDVCKELRQKHSVVPGKSWGSMIKAEQVIV